MSAQNVLILRSSPRSRANSSILADRLADGARDAGATAECFDLAAMRIQACDACDYCQGLEPGQCQIDDDMQLIYPRLLQAQAIVVATPIYWFTFSAQAKLCIDRWYALQGTGKHGLAGKQFALLLTYGDSDVYTSGAINAIRTFQDVTRYIGAEIAGMVYGQASREGEIRARPELLERAYRLGQLLGGQA